ncbi:hypothetical protein QA942_27350 [Streptomyces sp. B21-106]
MAALLRIGLVGVFTALTHGARGCDGDRLANESVPVSGRRPLLAELPG